jgi:hypothetical protein
MRLVHLNLYSYAQGVHLSHAGTSCFTESEISVYMLISYLCL